MCETGYGLTGEAHLSAFAWISPRGPIHLDSFHLTVPLGREVAHFYYREEDPGSWWPEGHTPSRDLHRLGARPHRLRAEADAVAQRLVTALGGRLHPRP